MIAAAYAVTFPVRFAHVDAAGIVYYPRYFELLDAAIEDWSAAVLGIDRRTLHLEQQLGLPMVRMSAAFQRPSRLGDRLTFTVEVRGLHRSSFDLQVQVRCADEVRMLADCTLALAQLEPMAAKPLPTAWRAALQAAFAINEDAQ